MHLEIIWKQRTNVSTIKHFIEICEWVAWKKGDPSVRFEEQERQQQVIVLKR